MQYECEENLGDGKHSSYGCANRKTISTEKEKA